jgi:hypothetical protein
VFVGASIGLKCGNHRCHRHRAEPDRPAPRPIQALGYLDALLLLSLGVALAGGSDMDAHARTDRAVHNAELRALVWRWGERVAVVRVVSR